MSSVPAAGQPGTAAPSRLDDLARHLPAALQPLVVLLPQLSRYTLVSATALAVDFMLFLALTSAGIRAATAGVAGYICGGIVHYALSVRYVFDVSASDKSIARRFSEFWLSGLVGLAITYAIIAFATDVLELPAMLAKIAAVGASFVTVYLIRRCFVFAEGRT